MNTFSRKGMKFTTAQPRNLSLLQLPRLDPPLGRRAARHPTLMPEAPVVIPEDVSPGDQFQARVAGKTITVTCPDDGEPGQTIMVAFDAPPAVSGQPKSRVKLSLGAVPGQFRARAPRCVSCDVDRLAW